MRFRGHYQEDDDSHAALAYLTGISCAGRTYPGQTQSGAATVFQITQPYACDTVPEFGSSRTILNVNTVMPTFAVGPLNNSLGDPFLSKAPHIDHTGMRRDTIRLALRGGVSLPRNFSLDFNLGFNNSDSVSIWDLHRSGNQNFLNIQPVLTDDLTADIRISSDPEKRVRGLLGASYYRQTLRVSQIDWNAVFGSTAFALNTGNFNNNKARVPAVYDSIDFDVTGTLTLTADMRFQKDKITNFIRATGAKLENETSVVLSRVIVSYKPNNDSNLFLSYAKVVQPLTLNTGYVNANAAQRAYIALFSPGASEFTEVPELDTVELGIKQQLFDDRLRYTLALYDSKWKHRITFTNIFNPASCNGPPLVQLTAACPLGVAGTNASVANDAKVRGLELSVDGAITDHWTAGANFSWTDATWDSYYNGYFAAYIVPVPPATEPIRRWDGNELAKVPDMVASLTTTYRSHLVNDWNWYLRGDLRYQGRMWESDLNIIQTVSWAKLYTHLGVEKENVTLEFYVDNLTNNKSWDFAYRLPSLDTEAGRDVVGCGPDYGRERRDLWQAAAASGSGAVR